VQKSLYAIAGLGLAGCLVLMLMLDRTLKVVDRPQRSEYETALDAEFDAGLAKPAKVKELDYGGGKHLHAHLVVVAGQRQDAVADRAGALLWELSERGNRGTVEVVLYVDDVAGNPQLVRVVSRGRAALRPPRPAASSPAGSPAAPR